MNAEDILGAILLFAFASLCLGLAGFIWISVWEFFEDTEVGQMIIERMREKHEKREEE